MSHAEPHAVLTEFAQKAHITAAQYQTMYQQSMDAPETFWATQAEKFITWFTPWTQVINGDFNTLDINWFNHGKLNACYNCVDRHVQTRKNQVAILWEGNSPDETQSITYAQLHQKICQFANVLKTHGIKKGDRVCIYLPMIPEAAIAMLACARIGAIHSVVFGGFSADALKTRLLDADCRLLITADEGLRGEKTIPFKANCDIALVDCPNVKAVIVVKRTGNTIDWKQGRDTWYHEAMDNVRHECPVEHMDANDPLFILYTSGSTGKPKGVVHNTGGYLVYAAMTHQYVFDYRNNDIYWCTADIGWITGHSYLVYGPLANGATTLMFEGIPNYPDYSRYWSIIDKHQVTIFYTAPTAIRALRREGDAWVTKTSRKSLRLLGSVGEPINPDVWEWYYQVVGENRCPIVNTWWQTETGGILLTPLPGATTLVAGSVGVPFFGIEPEIVDNQGNAVADNTSGKLVIKRPWPGLMQTIYGDKSRFVNTYFQDVPGTYLTGDGAYRDTHGYYWITGRDDDVIKVSGHRIGTEELESAFTSHKAVAEAAVVGVPHDIKGEGIFAFITLKASSEPTDALKKELIQHVRDKVGPLATPDNIQWTVSLPKTRSGKIMRRILRKIASNDTEQLGDISTLADADVIEQIMKGKENKMNHDNLSSRRPEHSEGSPESNSIFKSGDPSSQAPRDDVRAGTTHDVFVNRILNMKKIKYIGLDMDHTLIRYHTERFESLVYKLIVERLIMNKQYPEVINQLTFNFKDAIRGLVVDSKHGNILKLSRYGAIRQSYHGTKLIDFTAQKTFYRSTYVDLGDPNYMSIDTSFSIAFCVLYAQLVDLKDALPSQLPSYPVIAADVLGAVDTVHADGSLKKQISEDLDHYVLRDKRVVDGLKRYAQYGKKLFILTNSEYFYTNLLLNYAINPFLNDGETWENLFEYVITLSNKPRFFYDNLKFLHINPESGTMTNTFGPIKPGVYQGGNAKKFTDDLQLSGDEILYIGDHIYGDILRLKKDCNWRTALVVEELGEEIAAQKKALPIEHEIVAGMEVKKVLDEQYIKLQTKSLDEKTDQHHDELHALQMKISSIDQEISKLLHAQQAFFNPKWDRVFRAGAEESYFAYQVDRFACIYMEKISDLLEHSPLTYFRANRRLLAHD